MSGLAQVLAESGFSVQGSDVAEPYTAEALRVAGVRLMRGHEAAQLGEARLVVVSSAIPDGNPELAEARKRGVRVVHRAEILAEIMKGYSTIAVSGTHGKTSTVALVYDVLRAGGVDVGVINGGTLNALGSNAALPKTGKGWLVVEADESDASFLKLHPTVAVVTNIEPEHMGTYGSEEKLVEAFEVFVAGAGEAVVCVDDPNGAIVAARCENDVVTYGLSDDADVYARSYVPQGAQMAFDAVLRGGTLEDVVVNLPGVHYVQNALAALAVAQLLKLDVMKVAEALETHQGVGRRFSKVGAFAGADVIDDYGHHPTEIAATLEAAKGVYPRGKVVAVIQPHRYTRLRDLMEEFATCAVAADACLVLPVYAAGEEPVAGVDSQVLVAKMKRPEARFVVDEAALREALVDLNVGYGDAVVCLGAGSISGIARRLGVQA